MTQDHWQMLLIVGIMMGLMLCFSLCTRGNSRLYRWVGRIFWGYLFLEGAHALAGVGVNAGNLCMVSWLGLPGAAVLMAVSVM